MKFLYDRFWQLPYSTDRDINTYLITRWKNNIYQTNNWQSLIYFTRAKWYQCKIRLQKQLLNCIKKITAYLHQSLRMLFGKFFILYFHSRFSFFFLKKIAKERRYTLKEVGKKHSQKKIITTFSWNEWKKIMTNPHSKIMQLGMRSHHHMYRFNH